MRTNEERERDILGYVIDWQDDPESPGSNVPFMYPAVSGFLAEFGEAAETVSRDRLWEMYRATAINLVEAGLLKEFGPRLLSGELTLGATSLGRQRFQELNEELETTVGWYGRISRIFEAVRKSWIIGVLAVTITVLGFLYKNAASNKMCLLFPEELASWLERCTPETLQGETL